MKGRYQVHKGVVEALGGERLGENSACCSNAQASCTSPPQLAAASLAPIPAPCCCASHIDPPEVGHVGRCRRRRGLRQRLAWQRRLRGVRAVCQHRRPRRRQLDGDGQGGGLRLLLRVTRLALLEQRQRPQAPLDHLHGSGNLLGAAPGEDAP